MAPCSAVLCNLTYSQTLAWPVRHPQDLVHAAVLQAKGLDTAAAAVRVSGLELGGLAGSLSAGKGSAGFIE